MRVLTFILLISTLLFSQELIPHHTNPALMTLQQRPELYLQGDFSYSFGGRSSFIVPLGFYQTWEASVVHDFSAEGGTLVTGGYAINPVSWLSFGMRLGYHYWKDSIGGTHGAVVEPGISWRLPFSKTSIQEHYLGVVGKNLLDLRNNAYNSTIENQSVLLHWRAHFPQVKMLFETCNGYDFKEEAAAYSVAGRVKIPFVELGGDISDRGFAGSIGYSFVSRPDMLIGARVGQYWDGPGFINVQIRIPVGYSREESYALRMRRSSGHSYAGKYYSYSRTFIAEERYLEAIPLLGITYLHYPDFFRNDWVLAYIAAAFNELDLREALDLTIEEMDLFLGEEYKNKIVPSRNHMTLTQIKSVLKRGDSSIVKMVEAYVSNDRYEYSSITDSAQGAAVEILGEYYARTGQYQLSLEQYEKATSLNNDSESAKRGVLVAQTLIAANEEYAISDTVLINKYEAMRGQYEALGVELFSLIMEFRSSEILNKIDAVVVQLKELYPIVQEYEQAWKLERERIL